MILLPSNLCNCLFEVRLLFCRHYCSFSSDSVTYKIILDSYNQTMGSLPSSPSRNLFSNCMPSLGCKTVPKAFFKMFEIAIAKLWKLSFDLILALLHSLSSA